MVDPNAATEGEAGGEGEIWRGDGEGGRRLGEGSPRGSGEEADSLLRRSRSAGNGGITTMRDIGGRPVSVPSTGAALLAIGGGGSHSGGTGTNGSRDSRSTASVSDYGVLLHGGEYTDDDPEGSSPTHIPARPSTELGFIGEERRGHIIPQSELLRDEGSSSHPRPEHERGPEEEHGPEYSPLLPPPRLIDPDRPTPGSTQGQQIPSTSQKTSFSGRSGVHHDDLDDPMVLTARRVRMSQIGIGPRAEFEVGPRGQSPESPATSTTVHDPSPVPGPSTSGGRGSGGPGWGSLGLGGIARLSRLSWFKNLRENLGQQDSPTRSSHRGSRPTSYASKGDVEAARGLLSGEEFKREQRGSRAGLGLGLGLGGERPISSVSAKSAVSSATTIYHDARSDPETPPPLPPLPRAFLSGGGNGSGAGSQVDVSAGYGSPGGGGGGGGGEPPSYESPHMHQAVKDLNSPHSHNIVDILDLPAPASVSQFSSASSRGTVPFPPGLVQLPTPRSWYESSSSEGGGERADVFVGIDGLEDEPPRAGDGWRVLARNAGLGNVEHRSSFGLVSVCIHSFIWSKDIGADCCPIFFSKPQFVHSQDLTAISEVGSLHSMRSRLNPFSARSSGSAAASSHHNFSGSNSSRPSGQTASSALSLAHSGSISSDGRRRLRGTVSPALSAFGYPDLSPSSTGTGQFQQPAPPPPPYIPQSSLFGGGAQQPITVRSVTTGTPGTSTTGSADTETTYTNNFNLDCALADQLTGDSQLLSMPWATGLDDD